MNTFSRFSLRELLFVVLFAGLGLASLRAGGLLASATLMLAITMYIPDRQTFMSLGHVLIAMMFGYAGAKFAVGVHRWQRTCEPERDSMSREPAA